MTCPYLIEVCEKDGERGEEQAEEAAVRDEAAGKVISWGRGVRDEAVVPRYELLEAK